MTEKAPPLLLAFFAVKVRKRRLKGIPSHSFLRRWRVCSVTPAFLKRLIPTGGKRGRKKREEKGRRALYIRLSRRLPHLKFAARTPLGQEGERKTEGETTQKEKGGPLYAANTGNESSLMSGCRILQNILVVEGEESRLCPNKGKAILASGFLRLNKPDHLFVAEQAAAKRSWGHANEVISSSFSILPS